MPPYCLNVSGSNSGIQLVEESGAVQTVVGPDDQRTADPAGFDCHDVNLHTSVVRVDFGRGQNRTLREKAPVECATDRWSRDGEQLGEVADGILTSGMRMRSAPNSAKVARISKKHLSRGIARVVEGLSQRQFHPAFPKLVCDGAGIRDGPGQAVKFGHDQGVALAHGDWGRVEARSGAGSAVEAVVGIDAVIGDAQFQEGLALGVQVLAVAGTANVSDEGCRHGWDVRIGSCIRNCYCVPFI